MQVLKGIQDVLQFTQPLLLRELMGWVSSYLSDDPEPGYKGAFIAGRYAHGLLSLRIR